MKLFYSTRGDKTGVTAPEAVLRGIAPDGGLYMPEEIPSIPVQELMDADFCAMARRILAAYLPGYTQEEIDQCVQRAYADKFDAAEITPLRQVGDQYVLELFHGPTAAFKDVALSVLPQLMRTAMEKLGRTEDILILTATSGDTGSAALTGFCDVPGIRIIVFYPEKGISPIQRAQMTTIRGGNIGVCAIDGNFDDAQTGVKNIFARMDEAFLRQQHISLSSANSINIGRLVPQIVYYYFAYVELVRQGRLRLGDKLNFSVPTGNFGDILAGYLAKLSGLPVGRLVCASNANRVLTDFFQTSVYNKNRAFVVTTSPSMDILVSSNLERLLFLALDGDAQAVKQRMELLRRDGSYSMPEAAMERMNACFAAFYADDKMAADAIARVFADTGYVMDPHTAVAWRAAEDYRRDSVDSAPCVVLSTASPCKFPASVLSALGQSLPEDAQAQLDALEKLSGTACPAALDGVLGREVRFNDVIAPQDMMEYVKRKAALR